jgi:hypothetical protein
MLCQGDHLLRYRIACFQGVHLLRFGISCFLGELVSAQSFHDRILELLSDLRLESSVDRFMEESVGFQPSWDPYAC